MTLLSVSDVARELGVRPRDVSGAFYRSDFGRNQPGDGSYR